jgi:hypothetical protein
MAAKLSYVMEVGDGGDPLMYSFAFFVILYGFFSKSKMTLFSTMYKTIVLALVLTAVAVTLKSAPLVENSRDFLASECFTGGSEVDHCHKSLVNWLDGEPLYTRRDFNHVLDKAEVDVRMAAIKHFNVNKDGVVQVDKEFFSYATEEIMNDFVSAHPKPRSWLAATLEGARFISTLTASFLKKN